MNSRQGRALFLDYMSPAQCRPLREQALRPDLQLQALRPLDWKFKAASLRRSQGTMWAKITAQREH